ncbi:Acid phosphatase [Psilocybe cubensis]|uniref:Acid phosphatase n=2 Tax=Psilocybe cubensis TaxID=181762 RepID=A0ACB8GNM9_PSICU|nr:Acid phosphatase [Psilocybe cubensis]KAH9476816.1 Acid phosphatase [Psilocybe cubensis]
MSLLIGCYADTNIVLTNDDGWAVAQLRSEYSALKSAGYNVILSAPAINKSGTGSSTTTPKQLEVPCQFETCPVGSPAYGYESFDRNINYVNGYPVDAVKYGIKTLAPSIFGSIPTLVISGTNIGTNLGSISGSGTVGAAAAAALEGIPSIAFSGSSGSTVSYTTLTSNPSSSSSKSAKIYTDLVLKFSAALLNNSGTLLPKGVSLNVNFASTSSCSSASNYKFVLTRVKSSSSATDVTTCGTNKLTDESTAIKKGCIATVSVFNATTKADVGSSTQSIVLGKLKPILECL